MITTTAATTTATPTAAAVTTTAAVTTITTPMLVPIVFLSFIKSDVQNKSDSHAHSNLNVRIVLID